LQCINGASSASVTYGYNTNGDLVSDGLRSYGVPAVGDVGTLLDVLIAPGVADRYIVESSDGNGTTVWLGDFLADELEVVQPA
jgi:hypothetical protein